jgi:Cu(I)-responsive transcriptional regulator
MTHSMNIGEAALAAGVSTKMVRHYEQIGLLHAAQRSEAGYRRYGEREVTLLRFIRQARLLGFSMKQIADLLGLWTDAQRTSREVKALAAQHLADLIDKMQAVQTMKSDLERLVTACSGDDSPRCAILDELAVPHTAAPPLAKANATNQRRAPRHSPPPVREATTPPSHLTLMAWTHRVRALHPAEPSHTMVSNPSRSFSCSWSAALSVQSRG